MEQKQSSLGLLGKFGINLDSEIEGLVVTDVKQIPQRANVFGVIAGTPDGKNTKKFLVGKKTMEQGVLVEKDGQVIVASGFETYTNNEGLIWVRSKDSQMAGGIKMDF